MAIEIFHEDDIFTIEDTDSQEDFTIVEISSGEFEIECTMRGGYIKNMLLSREQMKEMRDWLVERLK